MKLSTFALVPLLATQCAPPISIYYIVGERGFYFHLKQNLSIFLFGKGPLNFFMYPFMIIYGN